MTAAASMAQVNVRMAPELKQAGEEAMSASGLTPTEVIRWVYQAFTEGRTGISRLLNEGTRSRLKEETPPLNDKGALLLSAIDERYDELFLQLGLDREGLALPALDDAELDSAYWDDCDRERGLGSYAV